MGKTTKPSVNWTIDYTRYEYDPEKLGSQSTFDPECLEETSAAFAGEELSDYEFLLDFIEAEFPGATADSDGDGYAEIDRVVVEVAAETLGLRGPFPLAALFVDDATDEGAMAGAHHDIAAAVRDSDNPLEEVETTLENYLRSIGIHAGISSGAVKGILSNDPHLASGYSVTGDGRLRIDCGVFAELAYEALNQIPDLEFFYIDLETKGGDGHRLLLVSDGKGKHLIVDNDSVQYLESEDPEEMISERYHCKYISGYITKVGKKPTLLFKRNPRFKGEDGCNMPNPFVM